MDFLKNYISNTNLQVRFKEKNISHVSSTYGKTVLEVHWQSDELLLFIAALAQLRFCISL